MNPKVSIIIPIYNPPPDFLARCLDSALAQTYRNVEVVCVDDGSEDKIAVTLKAYQKEHSNMVVLRQKNQGASTARNHGIQKSTGEFITFLDSDDALREDFVEQLAKAIGKNDVVFSGHERRDGDTVLGQGCPLASSPWAPYKFSQTCSKLYRREFLVKNKIEFPPQYRFNEDVFVTLSVLAHTRKIKVIDYIGYIAYRNPQSLASTMKNHSQDLLQWLEDVDAATSFSTNISTDCRLFFYLKTIITYLFMKRHVLDNHEYYAEYQRYFAWLKKIYAKYNRKLRFYVQDGEDLRGNLICNIFIFATKTRTARAFTNLLNTLHVAEIA